LIWNYSMCPSPERLGIDDQTSRPIIGLVIDRMDWHARQVAAALAARGFGAAPIRLHRCGFATRSATGMHIDGFGETLPAAVIVRSMSGGPFEAVTLRLGILHALRERGVMVWNDARAIERCVDKSMTSFLLARAGIATPPTWAVESYDQARAIAQEETKSAALVLKPLFGSQGRGLRLICRADDLPQSSDVAGGVYYLQRFVAVERDGFHDFRLLVVQGRVVAAMQRSSTHWITNVKRGGRPIAALVNDAMTAVAINAATAVGADFAGVDILYGADHQPTVLEVNSMPAWAGLQKVTSLDIAGALVAALTDTLAARPLRGATA
jgi:tetrahydromethanopterin:alpha-L-glutamate ligase